MGEIAGLYFYGCRRNYCNVNGGPHIANYNIAVQLPFKNNSAAPIVSQYYSGPFPDLQIVSLLPSVKNLKQGYKTYTVKGSSGSNKFSGY